MNRSGFSKLAKCQKSFIRNWFFSLGQVKKNSCFDEKRKKVGSKQAFFREFHSKFSLYSIRLESFKTINLFVSIPDIPRRVFVIERPNEDLHKTELDVPSRFLCAIYSGQQKIIIDALHVLSSMFMFMHCIMNVILIDYVYFCIAAMRLTRLLSLQNW